MLAVSKVVGFNGWNRADASGSSSETAFIRLLVTVTTIADRYANLARRFADVIEEYEDGFVFEGRSVLITGVSQGIGEGAANVFAEEGCNLHLTARNATNLERVKSEIRAAYSRRRMLNAERLPYRSRRKISYWASSAMSAFSDRRISQVSKRSSGFRAA